MGLGRTTRFAPLPPGARRVSVLRAGRAGIKELAPAPELLREFQETRSRLLREGIPRGEAHERTFRETGYRGKFLRQMRSDPAARRALGEVVRRARSENLYLMCMCPWRAPGGACHTYLLLELAREMDPSLEILEEPAPRAAKSRTGGTR